MRCCSPQETRPHQVHSWLKTVPLFSFRRSASPSPARSHPPSPGVRFLDKVTLSFSTLRVHTREDRLPRKHPWLQSTAAAEIQISKRKRVIARGLIWVRNSEADFELPCPHQVRPFHCAHADHRSRWSNRSSGSVFTKQPFQTQG